MEERGQSSDADRSYDNSNGDDGHVEEKSADSGEPKKTLKQGRINSMPDEILLHILSFLPAKGAIKTGALSQRWLNLWTSIPNLCFTFISNWQEAPEFATFVDKTLLSHQRCRVNVFIVKFHYHWAAASQVETWLSFATSANVEELSLVLLDSFDGAFFKLPQHVYTNSSITTLKLTRCNIAPNGLIGWKSLKSLLIGCKNLSEEVIQKILVGSPVLESLELRNCWGFNRLDIGSASLRKLVVRGSYKAFREREDESSLEISAPNLQSLGILGIMYWRKIRLRNIQSLEDCNLSFWLEHVLYEEVSENDYEAHQNLLRELLDSISHVRKLTVGNVWIEVLSMLELKGMLSTLSRCKCLVLDTDVEETDIPAIAGLLRSSPNLETLVINMTNIYSTQFDFDEKCPENYWTSQKESSSCSLLHLKTVKIFPSNAWYRDYRLAIPLVQFLLEKAGALEKMVINARREHRIGFIQKKLFQAAQELLSLPRSSPNVVITFSE